MAIVGTGLPVSRLVAVSWSLSALPASVPNLNTCLVLGPSPVIDVVERMREYLNIGEVATDFGSTTPEYQAAVLWFSQNPQPQNLFIGRWAQTATSGTLIGGALSAANQIITNWTAITNGGVDFTIDGVAHNLTALDFHLVTNLNGVASVITAALSGAGTVVWNASFEYFQLTSATTGTSSTVAFATAGAGTDISAMLHMTAGSSGAYVAQGIAAETALSAVTLFDTEFSTIWYGLDMPTAVDADHEAVAAFVEAANPPHYYGVTTQESGVLSPTDTSDIAYILQQFGYNKTAVQYSSTSAYAVASYLARILTTEWTGSGTAITMMYKQEPGVVPETLNNTQANAAQAKNCNVFANYANGTQLIEYGTCASGQFTDTIVGADALAVTVQSNVFNVLYTVPTKVPQTDAGMSLLLNAEAAGCAQFVTNGYLAPGIWNSAGFGSLKTGDLIPDGYYIFAPPMALQAESARANRQAPVSQIAAKLAGAIHTAEVLITINP